MIRFIGKDAESPGGGSPAVFIDEETGDFLFEGWSVTDAATLSSVTQHSKVLDHESVVRLPAHMREIIMEACREQVDI